MSSSCEGMAGFGGKLCVHQNPLFCATQGGALTTLDSFNGTNSSYPRASLVQVSDGNLYGTTSSGGVYGRGTIFRLVQPPRPLITAITRSGGTATLTWTTFTNGIYRVEYKPSLAATRWTALTPNVTATNSIASKTDNPGGDAQSFYRVVLLP